jgi:hypothetical protein
MLRAINPSAIKTHLGPCLGNNLLSQGPLWVPGGPGQLSQAPSVGKIHGIGIGFIQPWVPGDTGPTKPTTLIAESPPGLTSAYSAIEANIKGRVVASELSFNSLSMEAVSKAAHPSASFAAAKPIQESVGPSSEAGMLKLESRCMDRDVSSSPPGPICTPSQSDLSQSFALKFLWLGVQTSAADAK